MRSVAWGALLVFPLTAFAQDQLPPNAPPPVVVSPAPATDGETVLLAHSWDEVQAEPIRKLLQQNLSSPKFAVKDPQDGVTKRLAPKLGVSDPQVTVRKNYPPVTNLDGVPDPYLSISFQAAENVIGNPDVEQLAIAFVSEVLTQHYFSTKFVNDFPAWKENMKVWVGPEDQAGNPFQSPRGLSMPWRALAHRLGYLSSPNSTLSLAFTPDICREMAFKAIKSGLYEDAIVLANHGLNRSPRVDPTFLYLRAYSEITLGKGGDATETLRKLKATRNFPYKVQERLNGPAAVYLWQANSTIR